jgi:hypothetical protein
LNRKCGDAYYLRGWIYQQRGDTAKAEKDTAEAKRLGYKKD